MISKNIAILLATYNGEKYLREFLDSLVLQTNKNFKLVVGDDGSVDGTLDILAEYAGKIDIVILAGTKKLGPAKNFVRILVEVGDQFDYYFFADQDDFWNEGKIDRALSKLAGTEKSSAMYCSALELVDSKLSHISFPSIPHTIALENALVENIATGCTIAINSSARKIFIENIPENILMHDWLMYIVISSVGIVVYDDYASVKYRQHGGNAVGAATTIYHDIYRRAKRFLSNRNDGVFCISGQARDFYSCYSHLLSDENKSSVRRLIDGKKTMAGRISLAVNSRFVRQKPVDTLILRVLFLINRF